MFDCFKVHFYEKFSSFFRKWVKLGFKTTKRYVGRKFASCRGGSRIFLRRGAPLRNDVTDGEVKKFGKRIRIYEEESFISGGGGLRTPLHPAPRSAPEL